MNTSLGAYDKCPHCHSEAVSQYDEKKAVTICHNCGWITDTWNDKCKHCGSEDVEKTKVDYNKTYCYKCNSMSYDYYPRCPKCLATHSSILGLLL